MKYRFLPPLVFLVVAAVTASLLPVEREQSILKASGALRVFVMDALWMRMTAHVHGGNERLVLSDARTLLELDPDSPGIRIFLHSYLSFTMARRAVTEEEKARWIDEGLEILDEGLARDPDSMALNKGLGLTLFHRTEHGDEVFDRVCLERYGHLPVELAWKRFEKALDDPDVPAYLAASLINIARFEMDRGDYAEAAERWRQAVERLPPWLELIDDEAEAERLANHCRDLRDYCRLMARKDEEMTPGDVKKTEELRRRLEAYMEDSHR
jgi:tetratricopeptide (TPR) repeat protein